MQADLDEVDLRILELLERNGRLTAQELSDRVNLSSSQCARRRQRMEEEGVIRGYRAIIDQSALGVMVEAFVQIVAPVHDAADAKDLVSLLARTPEVSDMWTLTGDADFLLRVRTGDLSHLNRLVQEVLLPHPAVWRVQSRIVMATQKADGAAVSQSVSAKKRASRPERKAKVDPERSGGL